MVMLFLGLLGGAMNFRGAKKSTPYASQIVTKVAIESAQKYGFQKQKFMLKVLDLDENQP